MKTAISAAECGLERKESTSLNAIISFLKSKITDKLCISVASMAVVALLFSFAAAVTPAIVISGIVALSAVSLAPSSSV